MSGWINETCPHLPEVSEVWGAPLAKKRRQELQRGKVDEGWLGFCLVKSCTAVEAGFVVALHYAQSKWREGLPAQALLQLNKAMSVPVEEVGGLDRYGSGYTMPYQAVAWMLRERPDLKGQFLGNPIRHWQHYATRMSGKHHDLRVARAWACRELACRCLPLVDFPVDQKQLEEEGIDLPSAEEVRRALERTAGSEEVKFWQSCL